jgi:hypothetical protein
LRQRACDRDERALQLLQRACDRDEREQLPVPQLCDRDERERLPVPQLCDRDGPELLPERQRDRDEWEHWYLQKNVPFLKLRLKVVLLKTQSGPRL